MLLVSEEEEAGWGKKEKHSQVLLLKQFKTTENFIRIISSVLIRDCHKVCNEMKRKIIKKKHY